MLLSAVDAQPNLPAIIYEQQRITYAELGRAVAGLAQAVGGGRRQARRARHPVDGELDRDGGRVAGRDGDVLASRADQPVPDAVGAQEAARRCPGLRDRQRQAVRGEGGGRRGAIQRSDAAYARARRHDARRVEDRRVARSRSLAAAEARRFRAADFHGRLDGSAEGRQPHASWPALLGVAARDRLAMQVRRGAIPQRRADVPHLGARLFDARADLYAQHARHGAALRRRQSRARALGSQDHGVRRRPRADLHGLADEPVVREGGSVAPALLPVGRRAVPRRAASRMAREDRPADPRRVGHDRGRAVLSESLRRQAQAAVGRQSRAGHGAASRRSRGAASACCRSASAASSACAARR